MWATWHARHAANCIQAIQVISLGRGLHCHGPTSLGRGLHGPRSTVFIWMTRIFFFFLHQANIEIGLHYHMHMALVGVRDDMHISHMALFRVRDGFISAQLHTTHKSPKSFTSLYRLALPLASLGEWEIGDECWDNPSRTRSNYWISNHLAMPYRGGAGGVLDHESRRKKSPLSQFHDENKPFSRFTKKNSCKQYYVRYKSMLTYLKIYMDLL